MKKQLSQGAKKDLLVLNLVIGILEVALKNPDEVKNDKDLTKRDNKTHKLNRKIDKNLESLLVTCKESLNTIFEVYGDRELQRWVKSKLNARFFKTINTISEQTNMELLANMILFQNFMENRDVLISEFEVFTDYEVYSSYDLLIETNAGLVEDIVYKDAINVIAMIKG